MKYWLIVKEVLKSNDNDEDYLVRDTALQSLSDSMLTVGESLVRLKRLGDTKCP
jgi:hypothetical protein